MLSRIDHVREKRRQNLSWQLPGCIITSLISAPAEVVEIAGCDMLSQRQTMNPALSRTFMYDIL